MIWEKKLELEGRVFGRLLVVSLAASFRKNRFWHTRCVCGGNKDVSTTNLVAGHIKSCGCIGLSAVTKHNMSKTITYKSWAGIVQRCTNPKYKKWKDYGGRGIKVCVRWLVFENFFTDMGERPTGSTIERTNNSGDYEPCNCIWGTPKQQSNNRRNNRVICFQGKSKTLQQWSEEVGINRKTISNRLERGYSVERALTTL